MKRLLRDPFVHFLALGAALFALNAWREQQKPVAADAPRIEVTAGVIERLRTGYERQFQRAPDADELRGLITAHIREEVLCREALAMGLDRDDTIVRRRLAQKMEFLTADIVGAAEPDDAALQKFFAENAARYARPAQVGFRHVYFSQQKRGTAAESAAREALAALEKGSSDEALGDPFLHGFEFAEREQEDVIALFGRGFAEQITAQPAGAWRGPIASSYGLHLVRVDMRSAQAPVKLDDVRVAALRDLNAERRRHANAEVFARLRARYAINVDEAALEKAAAQPARTAQR